MKFIISKEQAQAVINLLGTMPYSQVYQHVAMLTSLPQQVEEKNDKEDD